MKKSDISKIEERPLSRESAAGEFPGVLSKRSAVGQKAIRLAENLMRRVHAGPLSTTFLLTYPIGRRHWNFVNRFSLWKAIQRRWRGYDNPRTGIGWPELIFSHPFDRNSFFDPAVEMQRVPQHHGFGFNTTNCWSGRLPSTARTGITVGATDPIPSPQYRSFRLSHPPSASIRRKASFSANALGRTQENTEFHAPQRPAAETADSKPMLREPLPSSTSVGALESNSAPRNASPVSDGLDLSKSLPQLRSMSSGRHSAAEDMPRSESVWMHAGKEFIIQNSRSNLLPTPNVSFGTLRFRTMIPVADVGQRLTNIRRQSMGVSSVFDRKVTAGNFVSASMMTSILTAASALSPADARSAILQTQLFKTVFRSTRKGNDLAAHDFGFCIPLSGGHGFQKAGGQAVAKKEATVSEEIGLSTARTNGFIAGKPVAEKSARILRSVRQTPTVLLSRGSGNLQESAPILNLRHPTIAIPSLATVSHSGQRLDHESTRPTVPVTNTVRSIVGNSPVWGLVVQAQSSAIGARPITTLRQATPTRPAGLVFRPGGLPMQPTAGLELAKYRPSSPVAEGAVHGIVAQKLDLPAVSRSQDVAVSLSAFSVFEDLAARSGETVALKTGFVSHKGPAPPSADIARNMTGATGDDEFVSLTSNTALRKTATTIPIHSLPEIFGASVPRKEADPGRVPHPFYNRPFGLRLIHRLVEAASSDITGRVNSATGYDNPVSLDSDTVLRKTAVTIRTAPWTDLFRPHLPRKENAESERSPHPFLGVPLSLGGIHKVADPVAVMGNLFRETNFGKPSPNRLPVVEADITSESPAQEAYLTSARSRTDAPAGLFHRPRPGIGFSVFQPAVASMERTISCLSTDQPVDAMSARHRRDSDPSATELPWISPAAFGAGAVQISDRDSLDNAVNRFPSHRPRIQRTTAPAPAPTAPGGSAAEGSPQEAGPDATPSRIDIDDVVDKTWEKIMRKLEIEQERRGQASWRFRS